MQLALASKLAATHAQPRAAAGARSTVHAGTALFLVSDGALGAQTFLLREPRPVLDSSVMATYTTRQGLIAAGVAGAGTEGPPR